jgi:kynureninase
VSDPFDLGPFPNTASYVRAQECDAVDPLAHYRTRFVEHDPALIYLDGNSLGRLPVDAAAVAQRVIESEWGDRLIRSWNERWWDLAAELGDLVAPIVGAALGEVLLSDSTTVNLYKLAGAALTARPHRKKIVTDDLNFPSDVYTLAGLAESTGRELSIIESDGVHGPVDGIIAALDGDTALLSLSSTVFKSGYTYDVEAITAAAHEVGALVVWDLSHSAGAVVVKLDEWNVDLAVGCTYKFLNGGPGSPAFLFVAAALQPELRNPISGWWGDDDPFGFALDFSPATDLRGFHVGTLPILSLSTAEPGIALVAEAGIAAVARKGRELVAFVEAEYEDRLRPLGFGWASPLDPARRGAHSSLSHPDAWPITQALIEIGQVVPDFRAPDNVRLGLSPLTTSFVDVATALERLARIVESGLHGGYSTERNAVT